MTQGITEAASTSMPLEVLLVEDNQGDVELTQKILQDSAFDVKLNVAEDGEVGMAFLRKEGDHANAPQPDLILLDLNMPKMDGYQVLDELDADPVLKDIPVMVLTSAQRDNHRLFRRGFMPSRYSSKPLDLSRFDSLASQLMAPAEPEPTRRWWWPFGSR